MNTHYKEHTLVEFYEMAISQLSFNVRKETLKDKLDRTRKHIIPYLGNNKITELTPLKLERWQNDLCRIKGADQTRRCKHILKSVLNRAIVYEIITTNPIDAIATIREPRTSQREVYTKEELQIILDNAKGQLRLFILCMVSLGVRSGEAIVLKFSDINSKNRTMNVQRAMRQGEIKETKTGITRLVDMPINLFNELKEYQLKHPLQEYIFVNKKGTVYKDSAYLLRRHFKPLLERLGVEYKSMYSLRHTFATLQLQGGQNINYVAKQLGHIDIRTTQEFYIKYLRNEEDSRRTDEILSF